MRKILQLALLVLGVVALIGLLADIVYSVASTAPSSTPAKVVVTKAGPYSLTVSFSHAPALAGYALPFHISSAEALTYEVNTLPDSDIDATPIRAQLSATNSKEVQGTAEITVQGNWSLSIQAHGAQGDGKVEIPIQAVAPFTIPVWTGWLIGGILPIGIFIVFFVLQHSQNQRKLQSVA